MRSSTSTFSAAPTNTTALSPRWATTGEGSRHLPRSRTATSAAVIWPASAVEPESLTAGAAVPLDETMALMFAFHGGDPADSGARRTSAVPAKCGQPCANPWCEGNLRMDGRDPNTLQKDIARNVRAGRGTGKRRKNRDF